MSLTGCTAETITPGVVQFDPSTFIADYPSFARVSSTALTFNFGLACLLLDNSCCSRVQDAPTREQLLNLLTAHITALLNGVNGQPPAGTVGRISAAAQGSISLQTEWASQMSVSEAFFAQTQWGAMYWQATLPYRSAFYVGPSCVEGPYDEAWNAWPQ